MDRDVYFLPEKPEHPVIELTDEKIFAGSHDRKNMVV